MSVRAEQRQPQHEDVGTSLAPAPAEELSWLGPPSAEVRNLVEYVERAGSNLDPVGHQAVGALLERGFPDALLTPPEALEQYRAGSDTERPWLPLSLLLLYVAPFAIATLSLLGGRFEVEVETVLIASPVVLFLAAVTAVVARRNSRLSRAAAVVSFALIAIAIPLTLSLSGFAFVCGAPAMVLGGWIARERLRA